MHFTNSTADSEQSCHHMMDSKTQTHSSTSYGQHVGSRAMPERGVWWAHHSAAASGPCALLPMPTKQSLAHLWGDSELRLSFLYHVFFTAHQYHSSASTDLIPCPVIVLFFPMLSLLLSLVRHFKNKGQFPLWYKTLNKNQKSRNQ